LLLILSKFLFAASSQIVSLPISFLSLCYGSSKLYYSQRLGKLAEENPCLKMTVIATVTSMAIIMSSLYSYTIMAIYFQQFVVFMMLMTIIVQTLTLKFLYFKKEDQKKIYKLLYNNQNIYGKRESQAIFFRAILTAWISPCTVWIPNTYFLLISSGVNELVHLLCMLFTICLGNFTTMFLNLSPSILNCLPAYQNYNHSKYRFVSNGTLSNFFQVFELCESFEDCLPVIRICSKYELPTDIFMNLITPIWAFLIVFSLLSTFSIQSFAQTGSLLG